MAKISPLKHLYVELRRFPKPKLAASDTRSREAWLKEERAEARTHLLKALALAQALPHVWKRDARSALMHLEDWFLHDEVSLEYELEFLGKLEAAEGALADLAAEIYHSTVPDEKAIAALGTLASPQDLARLTRKLETRWYYAISPEQGEAINVALAAVGDVRRGLAAEDQPYWHRLATSRHEKPTLERLARRCLAFGLGPREAAMIEAIVHSRGAKKTKPKLWFDDDTAALKRWRQVYERLAAQYPTLKAPPPEGDEGNRD